MIEPNCRESRNVRSTPDSTSIATPSEIAIVYCGFSGIVYAYQLRISVGQIVEDLEIVAEAATPEE